MEKHYYIEDLLSEEYNSIQGSALIGEVIHIKK